MIDLAFVDRADLKRYIGPPTAEAAYGILRGSALELMKKRIVAHDDICADFRKTCLLAAKSQGTCTYFSSMRNCPLENLIPMTYGHGMS